MSWHPFVLAMTVGLAAGSLAAQACPPPKKPPPAVRLTVAIKGCEYLGALGESTHVQGTSDCATIARSIANDPSSRVHALSRMLADSLRPIFAHHFGFLSWPKSPDSSAWSVTVLLNQPHRGADGTLQIVLRDPGGTETSSDALDFEDHAAITRLKHSALASVNARWAARVRTLLEANLGEKRAWLVTSVFRTIPIAALTPAEVARRTEGAFVMADVPVRDTDIRVKPPHRPKFEWQVQKVVRGQPPDEDEGVFELGECSGRNGYQCKLLRLRYGAAIFEGPQVAQFFDATTELHAPIALHILEYRPAANVCPLIGELPR